MALSSTYKGWPHHYLHFPLSLSTWKFFHFTTLPIIPCNFLWSPWFGSHSLYKPFIGPCAHLSPVISTHVPLCLWVLGKGTSLFLFSCPCFLALGLMITWFSVNVCGTNWTELNGAPLLWHLYCHWLWLLHLVWLWTSYSYGLSRL